MLIISIRSACPGKEKSDLNLSCTAAHGAMRTEFKFCSSSLIQCRRGWQPPLSGAARTPSVGCRTFSGQHFTSENSNEHLHGKDCARLNFRVLFADHLCGAENGSLWRWAASQSPTLLSISELWVLETLSSYSGHRALPVALSFKEQRLVAGDSSLPYFTPRPPSPNQSKSEAGVPFTPGGCIIFLTGFPHSYPHH